MINKEDLLKQKISYTYNGKVWKILGYCPGPSVTMECTTSKERINFGLGGEMDNAFTELKEETKDGRLK